MDPSNLLRSEASRSLEGVGPINIISEAELAGGESCLLEDRRLLPHLWLLPVRDLVAVGVWIASFAGHTVTWRGDRFILKNGRLIPIAPK